VSPDAFGIGKKKTPEQELIENAEPIDFHASKPAPIAPPPPPPPPPAVPEKSLTDTLVTDDLISKLVEEYGFDAASLTEVSLKGVGLKKPLSVHYRPLSWEDHTWGLAAVHFRLKNGQDTSLLETETQRTQFYKAITVCRTVVKIDGHWVWDLFKVRDLIKTANPAWSGETHIGVPDFLAGRIAQQVFDLFRKKLHYDLLFDLDAAVRKSGDGEDKDEDAEDEDENPTQAA
jgi:hypothetical protein